MKQHCRRVHAFLTLSSLLLSVAFSLASVQPVSAQSGTWYVSTTGSDSNACNAPESPCLTINGAIAKASNGDTIQVAVGAYTSDVGNEVVLINKSITISGGWDETFAAQSGTSIIDGSGARQGIKVYPNVTTTVEYFTIQNRFRDSAVISGIYNLKGILTVNYSSIIIYTKGAGIFNDGGTLALNNSTVSGNETGIQNAGTTTITNSTIFNLLYTSSGKSTIQNTILSTCRKALYEGQIISQGYNLIGNTTGCSITPVTGDQFNVDPQLGPLVEQTGTHPLASTSPAIDAGNNATCFGATDQRGQPRTDGPDADSEITCEIGSYEYTTPGAPASIHPMNGARQSTFPNTIFPQLLKVRVLDDLGTPVEGNEALFTAPPDGASGTFEGGDNSTSVLADVFGIATAPSFTANDQYGEYVVYATSNGLVDTAEFRLENGGWYVSPNGSNSNDCKFPSSPCRTINGAITKAANGDPIRVAVGKYTGSGAEVVLIDKSIILSGGWDETFKTQSGTSTIDGNTDRRGITVFDSSYYTNTVFIDHFTIQNGSLNSDTDFGGGIYNGRNNTLTLSDSIVSSNIVSSNGGGIMNSGTMIINNTAIKKNDCYSGDGGGIYNSSYATLTLNNSTVSGNRLFRDNYGSGINNDGIVILNNSTVSGNTGGGEGIYNKGRLFLNNSTIAKNQSRGVTNSAGKLTLQNTIIAGNGTGSDCYHTNGYGGSITSQGYNLIGNSTDCPFTRTTGDLVGTSSKPIDPKLGPLKDNGGPTFTHALYTISPAVDAGNPAEPGSGGNACLPRDQRGVARPKGAACDIGAYEGSVLKIIPAPLSPKSNITDTTPTFKWEKLDKATKYQYELLKGAQVIYSKIIPASACKAVQCANTPLKTLGLGTYKWKVRARIGGVWKSYSPAMTFKLFPAKPGFWQGRGVEFYVITASPKVDNFAIYIRVQGCGSYKITHTPLIPITSKNFSFGGSFYANGTFTAPTKAIGKTGLKRFPIPGCGYVTGGPFHWSTVWKNDSQPTMTVEVEDGFSVTLIPDLQLPVLQLPSDAFTVEPIE